MQNGKKFLMSFFIEHMPLIDYSKQCKTTCDKAFHIVKDFRSYPEFLPWCAAARLKESSLSDKNIETFIADLVISFKVFSEKFTTKVICDPHQYIIKIENVSGPFKYLKGKWYFTNSDQDHIIIGFSIDFEFKSLLLQKMIGLFFEDAMRRIIDAFEKRIYEHG